MKGMGSIEKEEERKKTAGIEGVRGMGVERPKRRSSKLCGEIKPVIPGQQWLETRSKEGETKFADGC